MLSHSPSLYFPQCPTVAHICYSLHSFTIILIVQCPNSSLIDTGLKVLSSWFALQASNIQQEHMNLNYPKAGDQDIRSSMSSHYPHTKLQPTPLNKNCYYPC